LLVTNLEKSRRLPSGETRLPAYEIMPLFIKQFVLEFTDALMAIAHHRQHHFHILEMMHTISQLKYQKMLGLQIIPNPDKIHPEIIYRQIANTHYRMLHHCMYNHLLTPNQIDNH